MKARTRAAAKGSGKQPRMPALFVGSGNMVHDLGLVEVRRGNRDFT